MVPEQGAGEVRACQQQRNGRDSGGRAESLPDQDIKRARGDEPESVSKEEVTADRPKNSSREFGWRDETEPDAVVRDAVPLKEILEVVDIAGIDVGVDEVLLSDRRKVHYPKGNRRAHREKHGFRNSREHR